MTTSDTNKNRLKRLIYIFNFKHFKFKNDRDLNLN